MVFGPVFIKPRLFDFISTVYRVLTFGLMFLEHHVYHELNKIIYMDTWNKVRLSVV